MRAQSIDPPTYLPSDDDAIIRRAFDILNARVRTGPVFGSPATVKDYLMLYMAEHDRAGHEIFAVLFMDSQHRLIETRTMFIGTLNQTSVYPREIAKAALELGAAAVVLAHNHPSGNPEPSSADERLTRTLKQTLDLVDVRVLDHMVTGGPNIVSMAERGLI